jgi:hypothetical protein
VITSSPQIPATQNTTFANFIGLLLPLRLASSRPCV